MHRTVFVGGIHGVGKTYFCEKLTEMSDVEHVTVSNLIKGHHNVSKRKEVFDIEKNQSALLEGLSNYRTSKRTLLIDGHFCLLNPLLKIERIPFETFNVISPHLILLLKDSTDTIVARLKDRDAETYEINLISDLQNHEIRWATIVSERLKVNMVIVEPQKSLNESINAVIPYL